MLLLDKQMRYVVLPAVLLLAMLLSSCGFRLQGTGTYPEQMQRTYVNAQDRYTLFYRKLRTQLEQGGAVLVSSPIEADAIIDVMRDETGRRVLTISGRNVPQEYVVYYNVRYSVRIDGEVVVADRRLSADQDFSFDAREVLGKKREEDRLRAVLVDQLVAQVHRDLTRLN